METLLQQIVNGLVVGSVYALVALGYTMVYGVLRFINFAPGDVFVFGSDFGEDEIRDFDANPRCGQDRIDLRALGISAASFAESVSIERRGDDTLVALGEQGSILCEGVDGEGKNVIDQADFLLLA